MISYQLDDPSTVQYVAYVHSPSLPLLVAYYHRSVGCPSAARSSGHSRAAQSTEVTVMGSVLPNTVTPG